MRGADLTARQRQLYASAPPPPLDGGRRRAGYALALVLGCERLLREGRLRGPQARLAAAQAQAARLLAAAETGARWATRRGDVLARRGDGLAEALAQRAAAHPDERLAAAHDLLDEVAAWLQDGLLTGPAASSAVDRIRVAQALLGEHVGVAEKAAEDAPSAGVSPSAGAPTAWLDD